MRVLDDGHKYALRHLEGDGEEVLTFIKRNSAAVQRSEEYVGTTTQEVLRALIQRTEYVDQIIPARENWLALDGLRAALYWLEVRAYRRHQLGINKTARGDAYERELEIPFGKLDIELRPLCDECGHILTEGHAHN